VFEEIDENGRMLWTRMMRLGPLEFPSFELMQRMLNEFMEFDELIESPLEELRARKYPVGILEDWINPLVYGYNTTSKADGKTVVTDDGNPRRPVSQKGTVPSGRLPVVDMVDAERTFRIILELPGVKREEIDIMVDGRVLTVSVDRGGKKYHQELNLPDSAKLEGARSTFNNGILEVVLPKESRRHAVRLKVE